MIETKFFKFAFAEDGQKIEVPDAAQPNGVVSYNTGYGLDYTKNYPVQDGSKPVGQTDLNGLFFDVTRGIKQYQVFGVPNFITSADNDGAAYEYIKYARINYDIGTDDYRIFEAKTDTSALPTDRTAWRLYDFDADKVAIDNPAFAAGVADGDLVYFNAINSNFDKAIANGSAEQNVAGFADVTNKKIILTGTVITSGLIAGDTYYLSTAGAGELTNTDPQFERVKIGRALSATLLQLNIESLPDSAPYFSRVTFLNTSSQSVPSSGVPQKVLFDNPENDKFGLWDNGASNFVIQKTGVYKVNAILYCQSPTGPILITLVKNGANEKRLSEVGPDGDTTLSGSFNTVEFSQGDAVSLNIRYENSGQPSITIANDGNNLANELSLFELIYLGEIPA